jgi:hypothetical protein
MSEPAARVKQRSGVEARPFPKGALLVDMGTGRCFRLNRVGAEIWTMLTEPRALEEVCRDVAARYRKPVEDIAGEIRALVAALTRENLIVVEGAPRPVTP